MRKTPQERFWSKVDRAGEGGCWRWTAHAGVHGYGMFYWNGRPTTAHRVSVLLDGRTIPPGYHVDHLCRNPGCVNPAHLEVVTPKENTRRGFAGAHVRERAKAMTHCKHGHEYTPDNTVFNSAGQRHCRECGRIDNRRRKALKRAEALRNV